MNRQEGAWGDLKSYLTAVMKVQTIFYHFEYIVLQVGNMWVFRKFVYHFVTLYYPFKKYVEYIFFSWRSEHDVTYYCQTQIGCPDQA